MALMIKEKCFVGRLVGCNGSVSCVWRSVCVGPCQFGIMLLVQILIAAWCIKFSSKKAARSLNASDRADVWEGGGLLAKKILIY